MPPTSLPSLVNVCPRSKWLMRSPCKRKAGGSNPLGGNVCCLLHPDSQITLESSSESEASRGGMIISEVLRGVHQNTRFPQVTSYNSERQALVESALVNRRPWETQDVETREHYFYRTAVFEKDFPTRIGTIAGGQKQ